MMSKNKIILIVVFLFIVGIFSFSISTGNFFFTTKYYDNPIEAYNADSTYNALYGNTSVKKEIGRIILDNKTYLFIGEIDNNNFVVNEMDVKNSKYSSKGINYFYDISEISEDTVENVTNISNGCVKWNVSYKKPKIEIVSNTLSVETFTLSDGRNFYVVLETVKTQGDG